MALVEDNSTVSLLNISGVTETVIPVHDDLEILIQRTFCELNLCNNPHDACGVTFPDILASIASSMADPEGTSLPSKVILTLLYSIITLVSLVGNSLVIITFALDKHMRSVTNVFILSLAAADLMVTLTCIPFNLGSLFTVYWMFGKFACKLVPTIMTFSVACSSLTLCSIALDRYVAIVHPHKLKFLQNPRPASMFLAGIWLVSLLCSIPNAVFYDLVKVETKCQRLDGKINYICIWPNNKYREPLMIWSTLIILFIIPFMFMFIAYGLIGYRLWIRKSIGTRSRTNDNTVMKKKVIQMLIIVMLVFVLCWSPVMILNAVVETGEQESVTETHQILKLYFQCLALISCCCNPVIYTFMNKKFRTKFATYLFCGKFCGKNRVAAEGGGPTRAGACTGHAPEHGGHRLSYEMMVPRSG